MRQTIEKVLKINTLRDWYSKITYTNLSVSKKGNLISKRLSTVAKLRKIQAYSSKSFGWLEYDSSVENH